MLVHRYEKSVVTLSSGRVLVMGFGETSDGFAAPTTAELRDPATGAWTELPDLNKPRTGFALAVLPEDRVLVAGGLNSDNPPQSYSSAYIYDTRAPAGGWVKTGLMTVARTNPAAATLADGRVVVMGGYFHVQPNYGGAPVVDLAAYHGPLLDVDMGSGGAALATAEIFDPASGTWSATGPMTYARTGAAAVTLADGRVLVVGSSGYSGGNSGFTVDVDQRAFDTAEIYDPATGRFTLAGKFPEINRAAIEAQGQPGANPMPEDDGESSGIGTLVATPNGAVLIGHANYWKHLADVTRSFRFDTAGLTWSEIGSTWARVGEPTPIPLTTPGVRNLSGALVATIGDARVLVAGGGEDDRTDYSDKTSKVAELYDPATDTWTPLPTMPDPMRWGNAVSLPDGSVLLLGGIDDATSEAGTPLTSVTRFIP
jgi:hypothetical protein